MQLSKGQNQGYATMPTTKNEYYSLAEDETQTILKPLESLLLKEEEKSTEGGNTPKLSTKKNENESEFVEEKGKSNSGFWSLKRRKDKSRRGSSVSNTSNASIASNTENEQSEPIIPVGKTEPIVLSSWNGLGTNPQDNNQDEETNIELEKSHEGETVLKNMIESGLVIDALIEKQNMTYSPRIESGSTTEKASKQPDTLKDFYTMMMEADLREMEVIIPKSLILQQRAKRATLFFRI